MYDAVQKNGKRSRRGLFLWIGLGAFLLVAVLVIGPVIWGGWYQQRWWSYVSDLSDSTNYAYDHDCLRADWKGRSIRVEGEQNFWFYAALTNVGRGRSAEKPETPPDARLIYGDGSTLYIWTTDFTGDGVSAHDTGVLIHYVNRLGEPFTYDTDRYVLETLMNPLFHPAGGARPWDG